MSSTAVRAPRSGRLPASPGIDLLLVLTGYLLSRLWSAVLIARAAGRQESSIWTGPTSTYFDMAQLWDGQWYRAIAESGYPDRLPVNAEGIVQQNAWAFFPGFPCTVKAVMALTGLPFAPAAVLLNLLLGGCAVYVVMKVLRRVAGRAAGVGGAVLLCAVPSAPALQIAYSESLALLLLALACWFLLERRYGWTAGVVLLLALTRPIVAPFAVVVLTHLVVRWVRRRDDPFGTAQRVQVLLLGMFSAVSSLLWPAVVAARAGSADAYERTQSAWRSGGVVDPFKQTIAISHVLWGERGPWVLLGGALLLVALVLCPWGARLGPELQTWTLAYPLYLLAITEPWTSTYRYLLLAFPLCGIIAVAVRSRWLVLLIAVVGLRWQQRWVDDLLVFHPPTDFPP